MYGIWNVLNGYTVTTTPSSCAVLFVSVWWSNLAAEVSCVGFQELVVRPVDIETTSCHINRLWLEY